jgi:Mannosyltransferase (PIG-M)
MIRKPALGLSVLAAWVAAQAVWLWQGYGLEMLGQSTFLPGLWLSSLLFFAVNCWILGIIVSDSGHDAQPPVSTTEKEKNVDAFPMPERTLKDEGVDGIDEDEDEEDDDSDIEEIIREQTVDEMVREEMKRKYAEGGNDGKPPQRNVLLRDYMADIQTLSPTE